MRSSVTFKSNGLKIAGHLYLPDDYKEGEKRPAIVVSHPCGGVKEQTAGLYAKKLSEKGFITLAFDASYQGESEGKPRYLEDPFARAEDIFQLVSQLGFNKIFLVGHDVGAHTAYSFAAAHPDNVSKLVVLDVPIPGLEPSGIKDCCWWFGFHQTRDVPEALTAGKEREYLSWFYRWAYNPEAITEDDIDEYVSHYSEPGGMRAGFEYYRAFPIDAEQNKEHSSVKLQMPVLVLSGEHSIFSTEALESMRPLATDVRGGIVPLSGHWIAEERPDLLIEQLASFLLKVSQFSLDLSRA